MRAARLYSSTLNLFQNTDFKIAGALTEADLYEKAGDNHGAAIAYGKVAHFLKNNAQKTEYKGREAFFAEKDGDKIKAARACEEAAFYAAGKNQKISYLQEAARLYGKMGTGNLHRQAQLCGEIAELSENKAEIVTYSIKAAKLYGETSNKQYAAHNYSRAALSLEGTSQGIALASKAFYLYEKREPYIQTSFLMALYISFYAQDPITKEIWFDRAFQTLVYGKPAPVELGQKLDALKKCPKEEVVEKLKKIAASYYSS